MSSAAVVMGPLKVNLYHSLGLVGLEFTGPINTVKVMLSWSDYLTMFFLGRFSPLND